MKSIIKTRRSRNTKTVWLRQLALAFMLPCSLSAPAFALGGPPAAQPGDSRPDPEWSVGTAIGIDITEAGVPKTVETGLMKAPQDQTKTPAVPATVEVAVGETIGVSVNAAVDYDEWRIPWPDGTGPAVKVLNVDFGFATDSVSYAWSGAGTFATPTSSSSNWTAPMVKGTYTLTCTLDDSNTVINLPQTGRIDDGVTSRSVVVKVVPPKEWDIGEGIGHTIAGGVVGGAVSEDGRMTSPQNQTGTPTPATVVVAPGEKLTPTVEEAQDWDHWKCDFNVNGVIEAGEEGVELDEVSYKWTAEGGGTLTDSDKAAAKWTAPLTPGRYRLTCTITDKPAAVNTPNTGTRDDTAPCVRYVDVEVWSAGLSIDHDFVAAGSAGNAAHQATVTVEITDADGNGVPGISPGKVVVIAGGYGKFNNPVVAATVSALGATDAYGQSTATFSSGPRVGDAVTLKLPYDAEHPLTSGGPTVSISQTWGDGEWDYPDYFDFGVADPISYKMSFERDGATVNIGGHGVTFENADISGWEWDYDGGFDWDEDGFPDGEYVYSSYASDDADLTGWNYWNGLSIFSMQAETGTGGGTYNGTQKIEWNDDFIVETIGFYMNDANVFDETGEDFYNAG